MMATTDLHFWGTTLFEEDRQNKFGSVVELSLPPVRICAEQATFRRNEAGAAITVLVAGQPLLASDSAFDEKTSISRLEPSRIPSVIEGLYQGSGVSGLARLEGDFVLIILDRVRQRAVFVTDKFGIRDIYVRRKAQGIEFASAIHLLKTGMPAKLNPLSTAFYLAQEGFCPSPVTILEGVTSLGRAAALEIDAKGGVSIQRYWKPEATWTECSMRNPVTAFTEVLSETIDSATLGSEFGLLLSGGVDSSLLALNASRLGKKYITLTGAVRGFAPGESDIARARALSDMLGVRHHSVIVDPADERLPEVWTEGVKTWTVGSRASVPLWLELGRQLGNDLGNGFLVVTGQMADTVADNNYTSDSAGYRLRRAFYSPWFYGALPVFSWIAPHPENWPGKVLTSITSKLAGARAGELLRSLIGGLQNKRAWLEGRVFGYGEFPGCSPRAFPLLRRDGFAAVADWYSDAFVAPALERMESGQFYAANFEMSLAMVMLHLDSRVVYQTVSSCGGQAFLPFLTARMVNFFVSLPYSARAIWREPKWVIAEARRRLQSMHPPVAVAHPHYQPEFSQEQLLLNGSLGDYFRRLLAAPSFPDAGPGLMELLDQQYLEDQLSRFQKRDDGVDAKLIFKLAALETWLTELR